MQFGENYRRRMLRASIHQKIQSRMTGRRLEKEKLLVAN